MATKLTSIGQCVLPNACDCIPPDNLEFAATTAVWSQQVTLDPSAVITPLYQPKGVTGELKGDMFHVKHSFQGCTAVYRIDSDCGTAVWTVTIPTQCPSPCPDTAPTIEVGASGQTTTTITLKGEATLGAITGIPAASVSLFGTELTIVGEVKTGPYSIELVTPCTTCKLEGEVKREVVAAPPPCDVLTFVRQEGDTNVLVGGTANYCYIYSGTGPVTLTGYDGLPLGLSATVTSEGDEHKICVSGTVADDKCNPDLGCRTGKLFLKNCAGSVEVKSQAFISADTPKPVFCVGLVRRIDDGSTPTRKMQALFFPPKTKLYVDEIGSCSEQPISTQTLTVANDGTAVFSLVPPSTTGACPAIRHNFRIRHDTCGVMLNEVLLPYCWIDVDSCSNGGDGADSGGGSGGSGGTGGTGTDGGVSV
jgi:hypothetical protein